MDFNILSPDFAAVLAGIAISSLTWITNWIHDKTGWKVFTPKQIAALIVVSIGLGQALNEGGTLYDIVNNTFKYATMAWMAGQGVYQAIKIKKKK